LRQLGAQQRFEDAARLRDRIAALDHVLAELSELDRLRRLQACVVVPSSRPGFVRAHAVARGSIAAVRLLPQGAGADREAASLVAEARRAALSRGQEDADELRLVASFLLRPPPELRVTALERRAICSLVEGLPLVA